MSVTASALPLARHAAFASSDLDGFRSYLSRSYCDHKLTQGSRHERLDACHHRVPLAAMSLNYLQYGAEVDIDIGPFETFFMLEIPKSGAVELDCGGSRHIIRPGLAAVISPTVPIRSRWSSDCGQLMVKISKSAFEQHLSYLLGRTPTQPLVFDPTIDLSTQTGASLARLCEFMAAQFEDDPGVFGLPRVSTELEQMLMSALLTGHMSNYFDALQARATGIAPRHVRKAVDYIEQNLESDISVCDLVTISGVSARALYGGFERFVGMPPQTLIKNMRLERARADLLNAQGGVTVAQIATRWNFMHLGRFSTDYRKRFGERPLDTLRR